MALKTEPAPLRTTLPVLVVSGYSDAERLEGQAPGIRVMRKPFRRLALVQEVSALIEAARPGDRHPARAAAEGWPPAAGCPAGG